MLGCYGIFENRDFDEAPEKSKMGESEGCGSLSVFWGVRFRVLIYKVVCDGILIKSLGFEWFFKNESKGKNLWYCPM